MLYMELSYITPCSHMGIGCIVVEPAQKNCCIINGVIVAVKMMKVLHKTLSKGVSLSWIILCLYDRGRGKLSLMYDTAIIWHNGFNHYLFRPEIVMLSELHWSEYGAQGCFSRVINPVTLSCKTFQWSEHNERCSPHRECCSVVQRLHASKNAKLCCNMIGAASLEKLNN